MKRNKNTNANKINEKKLIKYRFKTRGWDFTAARK